MFFLIEVESVSVEMLFESNEMKENENEWKRMEWKTFYEKNTSINKYIKYQLSWGPRHRRSCGRLPDLPNLQKSANQTFNKILI